MTRTTTLAQRLGTTGTAGTRAGWQEVRLLGWRMSVPAGCGFRLDQPCVAEHGSLGGWLGTPAGEVAFTLLWRPPGYWARGRDARDSRDSRDVAALQADFVDHALAGTRRDSRRVEVTERQERLVLDHAATLLDLTIAVRRGLGAVSLRRRQVLWTCAGTGRHLALEVSALDTQRAVVDEWFDGLAAGVACHGLDDPADEAHADG